MSEGVAVLDGDEDVDPEESLDALLASGHLDPWRCSQAKKLLGLLKEIEGVEEFSDAWDARADYHIETEFNLEEFLEDGRYLRIPGETSPGELPPYMLEADNFLCKLIGGVHDLIDSLQRVARIDLRGLIVIVRLIGRSARISSRAVAVLQGRVCHQHALERRWSVGVDGEGVEGVGGVV